MKLVLGSVKPKNHRTKKYTKVHKDSSYMVECFFVEFPFCEPRSPPPLDASWSRWGSPFHKFISFSQGNAHLNDELVHVAPSLYYNEPQVFSTLWSHITPNHTLIPTLMYGVRNLVATFPRYIQLTLGCINSTPHNVTCQVCLTLLGWTLGLPSSLTFMFLVHLSYYQFQLGCHPVAPHGLSRPSVFRVGESARPTLPCLHAYLSLSSSSSSFTAPPT